MSNIQTPSDDAEAILAAAMRHSWNPPLKDPQSGGFLWTCTCDYPIFQPDGAPVPDELISHPQSFGQMRGER